MHILIISPKPIASLMQVMETSYPDFKLANCDDLTKAKELLCDSGPYTLIVLNYQNQPEIAELLTIITEDIGSPATLLLGQQETAVHQLIGEHECLQWFDRFDPLAFKGIVAKLLTSEDEPKQEENTIVLKPVEDFVALKLKTFYLYKSLPYDAFSLITSKRFMKVLPKGLDFHEGTIQKLKDRNVRYLYLEKNNHIDFMEESLSTLKEEITRTNHEPSRTYKILISSATLVQDYVRTIGPSEHIAPFISDLCHFQSSFLKNVKSIAQQHKFFPSLAQDIGEQAIFKSTMCELMTNELNWTFDKTKERIFFTSLIHDSFIEHEDLATVLDLDTIKDNGVRNKVKKHSTIAAQFAQQFNHLTEIDFIIKEHHYIPDHRSFPEKVPLGKINQVSALFIIINHYASELINYGPEPKVKSNLIRQMDELYTHTSFKNVYAAFKSLLKRKVF